MDPVIIKSVIQLLKQQAGIEDDLAAKKAQVSVITTASGASVTFGLTPQTPEKMYRDGAFCITAKLSGNVVICCLYESTSV